MVFIAACDLSFIVIKGAALADKYILMPVIFFLLLFFIFMLFLRIKYLKKTRNMRLTISPQDESFYFGNNGNMTEYKKTNISEINIIGPMTNKGPNLLNIMEICFIDGSKINIPAMLIDPYKFKEQFTGIKFNVIYKPIATKRAWWEYACN
jgi:hypothetical protein